MGMSTSFVVICFRPEIGLRLRGFFRFVEVGLRGVSARAAAFVVLTFAGLTFFIADVQAYTVGK